MTMIEVLKKQKPIEEIKELIAKGADVNAKSREGWTVLMFAKTAEQTKLLIEAGADVNAKSREGETALMFAKTAEQTKLLIEAGADVNAKDKRERTVLMKAKTAEQAKLLIEAGADVNARDKWGRTALMYADFMSNKTELAERMKVLVEAGADIYAQDNDGKGVLAYYLESALKDIGGNIGFYGELEPVKFLLEKGVSLEGECCVVADEYNYNIPATSVLSEIEEPELMNIIFNTVRDPDCVRKHIEERKANIKKSRQIRKCMEKQNPTEKFSNVALADEIAKDKISGKEKRTITPGVALDIKRRKAAEK